MITAREALDLAPASESDRAAAAAILAELDAHVRVNMKRAMDMSLCSCAMPIDTRRLNPGILCEVGNSLRQAGWQMELVGLQQQSAITQRMEVTGYQIRLRVLTEVFDQEAREIRAASANGVAAQPVRTIL